MHEHESLFYWQVVLLSIATVPSPSPPISTLLTISATMFFSHHVNILAYLVRQTCNHSFVDNW